MVLSRFPMASLKGGRGVIIKRGSFKDFEGIFEDVKDSERIIILLNLISYQAKIVVEAAKVGRAA